MRFIRPNCRAQFTAADFGFLEGILSLPPKYLRPERLLQLRDDADDDDVDKMLDHPKLFRAILELRTCIPVSMHFYFYILVRHVLLKEEIKEREVADYVAEILAEFALLNRLRCLSSEDPEPLDYLFDMVLALERLDEKDRFAMQSHIGNYALFFSGIFPIQLKRRVERRGAPGFQYYENLGSAYFKMAGSHVQARRLEMVSIYHTLGEAFHLTRLALNHLSEKLVFLETDKAVHDLLMEIDRPIA